MLRVFAVCLSTCVCTLILYTTLVGQLSASLWCSVFVAADDSLAFGDEVFDPPTISNPNLFTSHSSVPDVDQTTGAFVHRVPLDIPPGRNGLTPDLALQYNSQQLEDGIVGYGWSLSLPYIERFNRTGIDRLYTDNYFTSSLGGELATTSTANEYRHRFEDGRFIAYTFSNNSWIAYDKKGTKYTFGASTTAQLYATTTPSNVYRWMLEEIRDSNNNYITYFYERDSATNQIYPTRILYTGNGSTNGIFQIDFTRATRTDPITSYKTRLHGAHDRSHHRDQGVGERQLGAQVRALLHDGAERRALAACERAADGPR